MRIYCDSSVKEACLVVEGQEPKIVSYPEAVTVNVGEYRAVLLALEEANYQHLVKATILTDSLLVVNQVNGVWRCKKKHLLPYRDKVRDILLHMSFVPARKYSLNWIPREENLAGKVLE